MDYVACRRSGDRVVEDYATQPDPQVYVSFAQKPIFAYHGRPALL
ncbi:hypothetical protein ACIBEK_06750 [Nocardia fusca]